MHCFLTLTGFCLKVLVLNYHEFAIRFSQCDTIIAGRLPRPHDRTISLIVVISRIISMNDSTFLSPPTTSKVIVFESIYGFCSI